MLKLAPYQGGRGCLVIPFDKGVRGAAACGRQIQIVTDVRQYDGHIVHAASTQSERLIPVFDKGQNLVAVLDIDSDQPAFFSRSLAKQLETLWAKLFGPDKAV